MGFFQCIYLKIQFLCIFRETIPNMIKTLNEEQKQQPFCLMFLTFLCYNLLYSVFLKAILIILFLFFGFMMCQIFSVGERFALPVGLFSTQTLTLQNHAAVVDAICSWAFSCWIMQGLPWKKQQQHNLDGSIYCSKTCINLWVMVVFFQMCKLPKCTPTSSEMQAFKLSAECKADGPSLQLISMTLQICHLTYIFLFPYYVSKNRIQVELQYIWIGGKMKKK